MRTLPRLRTRKRTRWPAIAAVAIIAAATLALAAVILNHRPHPTDPGFCEEVFQEPAQFCNQ